MLNLNKLWEETKEHLTVMLTAVSFDLWIKNLEPYAIADGAKLVLVAPTRSARDLVKKNYSTNIMSAINQVTSSVSEIVVITEDEKGRYAPVEMDDNAPVVDTPRDASPTVMERYTFDSFVVGPSNQFVHAAARSVADAPGSKFNPLFIHGGVGLGKTHLMHAIGNHVKNTKPQLKVLYVTADTLTNELVDVIRDSQDRDKNREFRNKYRNVDLLMIDDVQHVAGKAGTQSALFNIFNDLFQNGKQIVMTSDRPPKEFNNLEERLKTRFEWGLIADISAPDIETRIAILQKKAEQDRRTLPDDVLKYIATKVESNIREMEGLYHKVVLFSELLCRPISIETAREALKDYVDDTTYTVDIDAIIDNTCEYFRVDRADLCGKCRAKEIAEPRMISMYLICDMLALPLKKIGLAFGGKDHTTVIHARDKITDMIKTDPKVKAQVKDLRDKILKR